VGDATQIFGRVQQGDPRASDELLPLVYDELRKLASARMARESGTQTLQATALVHEAWLRLVRQEDQTWQNRAHFFTPASEAMRRILVANARRKCRLKRGGGRERLDIQELELADTTPDEKVLLIDETRSRGGRRVCGRRSRAHEAPGKGTAPVQVGPSPRRNRRPKAASGGISPDVDGQQARVRSKVQGEEPRGAFGATAT